MSRVFAVCLLLGFSAGMWAQQQGSSSSNQTPANSPPTKSGTSDSSGANSPAAKPAKAPAPNLTPPRSDRVDAGALGDEIGESSSKDTQIDLSPPENDARTHPQSSEAVADAEAVATSGTSVGEFHPVVHHPVDCGNIRLCFSGFLVHFAALFRISIPVDAR